MQKERIQELAALHSVGAIDGEDAREFYQLKDEADCLQREMAAFGNTMALMAQVTAAPIMPPMNLKSRVMERVRTKNSAPAPQTNRPSVQEGFRFLRQPAMTTDWLPLPIPGASVKLLSLDQERGYAMVLGKLAPGARYPKHRHVFGEEVFMLSGDLHIGEEVLQAGDFHHAAAGTVHEENYSVTGCTILAVLSTADLQAQMQAA